MRLHTLYYAAAVAVSCSTNSLSVVYAQDVPAAVAAQQAQEQALAQQNTPPPGDTPAPPAPPADGQPSQGDGQPPQNGQPSQGDGQASSGDGQPPSSTPASGNGQAPSSSSDSASSMTDFSSVAGDTNNSDNSATSSKDKSESTDKEGKKSKDVSTTTNGEDEESGGLDGGAIAGIIIGCIAGVALIGAAAYFFMRTRRQQEQTQFNVMNPSKEQQDSIDYPPNSPEVTILEEEQNQTTPHNNFQMMEEGRRSSSMAEIPEQSVSSIAMMNQPSTEKFSYDDGGVVSAMTQRQSGQFNASAPDSPRQSGVSSFHQSPKASQQSLSSGFEAAGAETEHSYMAESTMDQGPAFEFQERVDSSFVSSKPSFAESYGKNSYSESFASYGKNSYTESFAESYGKNSYSDSFASERPFTNSYVQGMDDQKGSSMNDRSSALSHGQRASETNNDNGNSHWMDAMDDGMRDTNDSYAMLDSASFSSRDSAFSRFSRLSTESDMRNTQTDKS